MSFENNLSEKRLDEFAQTHFLQLKTPIVPRYWIKLTGITYEEKLETVLKTNIKNKIGRVNMLQIYMLLQIDKLGNETHLMINTTKNVMKSKLECMMIFFL